MLLKIFLLVIIHWPSKSLNSIYFSSCQILNCDMLKCQILKTNPFFKDLKGNQNMKQL